MPPKGKRGPKAYKLPDPIPPGEILTDLYKKQWKLGQPVGQGGFGVLYMASPNMPGNVGADAEHVVKIEPHENGPLFVELAFYQRAAKADKIDSWKKKHKMSHLGIPHYIGSGNHEHNKTKYRFMVMQRFGEDLWKKFNACAKMFSIKTAFTLGVQIVDALEYLHGNEYVHADIKSSNLLLSHGTGKAQHQAYLVDFGLAHKYCPDGKHKEYKEDPRKAHDGTAEFTSIDAHKGVCPSRRGDLEILGYNLVEWLTGSLPWYNKITDCNYVMQQKISCMDNISSFLTKCFTKSKSPAELKQYLEYVAKMGYTDKPDYNKVRTLFKKAIVNAGFKDDGKLEFAATREPARSRSPVKKPAKKRKSVSDDSDSITSPKRQRATPKSPPMTPQQKKTLKVNAANSTDSPAPKKRAPPKSASAKKSAAAAAKKTVLKSPVAKNTRLPETTNGTPASAKKIVRRKRRKVESSTSATQTTPGLRKNTRSNPNL